MNLVSLLAGIPLTAVIAGMIQIGISCAVIIRSKRSAAQIIFEQLTEEPKTPYSAQKGASFQDEVVYKGLGNYKEDYEKQTWKKLERTKEDIEGVSQRIYANVLTIMGVFVAIFSLLTINYYAFSEAKIDFRYIWVMNFTLMLCIVIMLGLIFIFINKAGNKKMIWAYIAVLAVLTIITAAASLVIF